MKEKIIMEKRSSLLIELPFKTPTINHLYGSSFKHNRRYIKPEAKILKEKIKEQLQFSAPEFWCLDSERLKVEVEIYEDWLTKNGEVKRKDLSNREKFIIDSVFDALGIDDKFIFEHTMKKIQSEVEKCQVKISIL